MYVGMAVYSYVLLVIVSAHALWSGCHSASCRTSLANMGPSSASTAEGFDDMIDDAVEALHSLHAIYQQHSLQPAATLSSTQSNWRPPPAVLVTPGQHPGTWLQPVVTAYVMALLTRRVILVDSPALLQHLQLPFLADWRLFAHAYSSAGSCLITKCKQNSTDSWCQLDHARPSSIAHVTIIQYKTHDYDIPLLQDIAQNKAFFDRHFPNGDIFHSVAAYLFTPTATLVHLVEPYQQKNSTCTIGIDVWHAYTVHGMANWLSNLKMVLDAALIGTHESSGKVFIAANNVQVQDTVAGMLTHWGHEWFADNLIHSHSTAFMVKLLLLARCTSIISTSNLGLVAASIAGSKPLHVALDGSWHQSHTLEPCITGAGRLRHRATNVHQWQGGGSHQWIADCNGRQNLQVAPPDVDERAIFPGITTSQLANNLLPPPDGDTTRLDHPSILPTSTVTMQTLTEQQQQHDPCDSAIDATCNVLVPADRPDSAVNVTAVRLAASKPVRVVMMSEVWWPVGVVNYTAKCSLHGVPLACDFSLNTSEASLRSADCLYYHLPTYSANGGIPRPKAFPTQLRLAVGLENPSAGVYRHLDDPHIMCQYDAEMSYRTCSQSILYYHNLADYMGVFNDMFQAPLQHGHKIQALLYINGNCSPMSGRAQIMRDLMALNDSRVPVHSIGACDHNTPWPANITSPAGSNAKRSVQQRYMFCVAMENSIAYEYVTEKLWDSLVAGCIPVYLGTSVALEMIPDRSGVIYYDTKGHGDVSTPQELATLLSEVASSKEKYDAMMAWKYKKPEDQPNKRFRALWNKRQHSSDCDLCQFIVNHRVQPKPRYTTCLSNTTWLELAGRNSSTPAC